MARASIGAPRSRNRATISGLPGRGGTTQGLDAEPISGLERCASLKETLGEVWTALVGGSEEGCVDLDRRGGLLDLLVTLLQRTANLLIGERASHEA